MSNHNTEDPQSALKPTITARDLSYHEAKAGIAAREEAAKSGGDPAQVRSLAQAAIAQDNDKPLVVVGKKQHTLGGLPLRRDDLLVTLCLMLYKSVFGEDPRVQLSQEADPAEGSVRMRAIAALAFIFAKPEEAYDMLDYAADKELPKEDAAGWARDFRRASLKFAGHFCTAEIMTLTQHILDVARTQPPAEEGGPGK